MSSTAYRALVDDLIAENDLMDEVVAAFKELDSRRGQKLIDCAQKLLGEQRAERRGRTVIPTS